MDVNRKPKLRDDPAGDARSFGSNYIQSSQSRKMSIGIVIDSVAKCRMQKVQQVGDQAHMAAVKTSSKEISVDNGTTMTQKTSSKGNFTNDRNKKEISNTSAIRNQREPTEQQTSPWISTKTLHHEPTSEAVNPVEKPSIAQGVVEMCNISHRVEVGPAKSSLRSFLIQTRTLQFDKSKQVKEDASIERRGKFASKVVLEDMPEKEVKGKNTKTENAGNASLRLKLQEILGTVSSPNNHCPNSQVLEQGVKTSKPAQRDSGNNVGEPRQNSDTIESDTQSHEYAIRRPTTRSLARKRAPGKLKSQNIKRPAACKEDRLEKNVFLPEEKNVFLPKDLSSRTLRDAGTSPLMVYERRGKRKSHHIEASKVCEQNNERKDEKTSKNCKRVPVPEKFVYPGDGTTLFQEKNDEMVQPDAGNLESPVVEVTEQLRNLREHIDQKENSVEKSKRKALDSEKDLSSRTLRDAGTSSPSLIYERRGKRKSHHIEASKVCEQNNERKGEKTSKNCKRAPVLEKFVYPGHGTTLFQEENDEMVQPDAGNLESPVVEMTEQLRNLREHIDQKENSVEKSKRKALDSEKDLSSRTLRDAGTSSPSMIYERRGKRKSHHIEASKVCEQNNERKDEKTSKNCKRVPVPEKFVYPGDGTTLFQEKNDEMVQPDAGNLESPVVEVTEQLRNLREHIDQKENSVEKSKRKALDSEKDLLSRTLRDAGTSSPSMIYERRGKRKSHHIEASKVCEQNNERKGEKTSKNCKRAPVLEKFVYPGHGTTSFQEENDEMVQPDAGNLESPVVEMTEQLRNLQKHIDQKENSAEKSKRKALDSESDEQSPTFALKTPGRKSFPGFAPRSNLGQLHGDDHENITSKPEGICKVKSFDGLKREYKSNTPNESSDDAGNLEITPFMESRHIIEEDTQKPSSMESDPEDSEDSSNIQAGMQQPLSPEICNTRKQQAPRPNKRLFNKGCGKLSGVSLAAASSKGIDCRKFERHFEQNEEDALTSATTLFSFSLEKVRSKLKSVTNKKSAEILKSVAEKIQMQLQNAEFQIQADMGRITSLNKSKRKHVEEVLQEKQQHLNAIYEKFKEEVTRHLQDCKSTLESLEAHEVEVKATVEKRKASNKKLLLEVEESIKTQLDNTERRVSSVYHAAREKLRQLKFGVAECLKEDVLG